MLLCFYYKLPSLCFYLSPAAQEEITAWKHKEFGAKLTVDLENIYLICLIHTAEASAELECMYGMHE